MDIYDINAKKISIEICYSTHITSTFYKKTSLNKSCAYNGLEHDTYSLINKSIILLLGDLMLEQQLIKLLF